MKGDVVDDDVTGNDVGSDEVTTLFSSSGVLVRVVLSEAR